MCVGGHLVQSKERVYCSEVNKGIGVLVLHRYGVYLFAGLWLW